MVNMTLEGLMKNGGKNGMKLTKDSVFLLNKKEIKIKDVLPPLVLLPAEQTVYFFDSIGLKVPRKLRIDALKVALDPVVKSRHVVHQMLSDEVNYRLRWYGNFSETQLVNLMPLFGDEELVVIYKEALWLSLLGYILEKKVSEENLTLLFNLANDYFANQEENRKDILKYNQGLNPIFFDEPGTIDGLTQELFRPILFKCSTLVEVREIGRKYGVNVPRRLKKKELLEIIKEELAKVNKLNESLEIELNAMNVIMLQRFAVDNDIKASIELKKEEIIEYILKNATETKEVYFSPSTGAEYEILEDFPEVPPATEPVVEKPVVEEPVVEEPVVEEPVVEEPVVEEPVVEEPVVEEPVVEEPVVEEPVVEEPVVEEPVVEEPVVEEPVVEEPVVEEPVVEEFVALEPIYVFPTQVKVSKGKWAKAGRIEERYKRDLLREYKRNSPVPVVVKEEPKF